MLKYFYFLLFALFSCSEYDVNNFKAPEIEVSPYSYDFGKIFVGNSSSATILIKNIGDDTLHIRRIYLSGDSNPFNLIGPGSADLEPDEELTLHVEYNPNFYESNASEIIIKSDDIDERTTVIELVGSGSAPVINISPNYFDFGTLDLGCEDNLVIDIKNIGDVDLEITDIDFLSTIPSDFNFVDLHDYLNGLPITLGPNEAIDISFEYIPTDLLNDSGTIQVHSNDPVTPIASASQVGMGKYGPPLEEVFTQDEIIDVDILFVVDNSCSMVTNQTNLMNNFSSFINIFSAAGANYRIAFITTDNSRFIGSTYISSSSPDPISEAVSLISSIGTLGSAFEKGILQAYNATLPSGDAGMNGSFIRNSARFVVIFISDERDFSTAITATDLSNHILSMKPTADLVAAHAVAGDFPNGCSVNGGADFGAGYYDVVNNLGGSFISICSSNWGADLEEVARGSILSGSFTLSSPAIEGSIEVWVDGLPEGGWYFDESTNSVVLSTPPPVGSEISIIYSTWEC